MYDFYFGTNDTIDGNPRQWLLSIKRMLPRWINGIPDSEYLALYDLLMDVENDTDAKNGTSNVLLETGCGASTVVLLYFALRWNTTLYTWDTSSNKLAYLRGVLTDTLLRYFRKPLFDHWHYVAYPSTDPWVGIPMLQEINAKVCACFLDSDHTWRTLGAEIMATCPLLEDKALVAIDDGNYRYKMHNTAYINMLRTKLDLPKITIENNDGRTFWEKTEELLISLFVRVENLKGGTYRSAFSSDIFFDYYSAEKQNTAELGMEKLEELKHRFDAWRVHHG